MGWLSWGVFAVLACLIAAITNGFLAPLKVHFRADLQKLPKADPQPVDAPFVGLALSGGGARAAIFAAAGMQALHERGLLAAVTHVSSVSGGGFAASYLALHPVPDGDAARYFDKMQAVLAHDYFWATQAQQLRKPPRLFSPSRRLESLKEALERPDFLDQARFDALPGDRTFYFNAVSYDTGRRFVFSNKVLPPPDDAHEQTLPPALRALSFCDAKGLRATPHTFPISLAVATSAAFPPYLGPMTIEVDTGGITKEYWHLGDGGVVENTGIETLREAVYGRKSAQPATIYAFDAGQKLDSDLSKNTHDISIWSRDVTRLVDVVNEYATAHRLTMFNALDEKTGTKIDLVTFDYMEVVRLAQSPNPPDPRWLSWTGWNHATPQDRLASKTPADHLAKIPTALKITPCNQELISAAAAFLVEQRFPR
jgi:predicted acylesterase/phospholipase RssA